MQNEIITQPLTTIEALFRRAASDDNEWGVGKHFARLLLACDGEGRSPAAASIPVLTKEALARGDVAHGTLVRWRCMVQDQFDHEYFVGVHEGVDGKLIPSKFCE